MISLCARDFCKNSIELLVTNVRDAEIGSRGGMLVTGHSTSMDPTAEISPALKGPEASRP